MAMNDAWAIKELEEFIERCIVHKQRYDAAGDYAYRDPAIKALHTEVISTTLR
jgi:hypothetical protein